MHLCDIASLFSLCFGIVFNACRHAIDEMLWIVWSCCIPVMYCTWPCTSVAHLASSCIANASVSCVNDRMYILIRSSPDASHYLRLKDPGRNMMPKLGFQIGNEHLVSRREESCANTGLVEESSQVWLLIAQSALLPLIIVVLNV
jgi:hypothetical protein